MTIEMRSAEGAQSLLPSWSQYGWLPIYKQVYFCFFEFGGSLELSGLRIVFRGLNWGTNIHIYIYMVPPPPKDPPLLVYLKKIEAPCLRMPPFP